MPDFDRWQAAEEPARMALSRRLLRENPILQRGTSILVPGFSECGTERKVQHGRLLVRHEWQGRAAVTYTACFGLKAAHLPK